MSDHAVFEAEKMAIERMVAQGYRIYAVREHLEGAHVIWGHPDIPGEKKEQYVGTASGRKWFSHILISSFRSREERRRRRSRKCSMNVFIRIDGEFDGHSFLR